MNANVSKLLNEQINKEFYSAYLYLDFANYYASVGLDGFENWYRVQAQEERDHAMLFYQYLQNNGEGVTFEAIAKPEWERGGHMTPLKKALEHEKTPELAAKLAEEAVERDSWAAEVSQLAVPKLVEQVALNAWKEQEGSRVCLHLRPSQRHLNSASAQQKLAEALGGLYGTPVELTIVEDDNPAMRTPLEWRQAIYEEKLAQAREAIIADNNIQTLRRFFDADLDEESIRPI